MRQITTSELERYRCRHPSLGDTEPFSDYGYFVIPTDDGEIRIISSGAGGDWEHVSVSHPSRVPTWDEMQRVKELFWSDEETVLQFHPCKAEYVNTCERCLHLWKQRGVNHALPPRELI